MTTTPIAALARDWQTKAERLHAARAPAVASVYEMCAMEVGARAGELADDDGVISGTRVELLAGTVVELLGALDAATGGRCEDSAALDGPQQAAARRARQLTAWAWPEGGE